jgi:hypothetical protein
MPDHHTYTPPPVAAARIFAIYRGARSVAIRTGGDPAEAAYELVCAAALILYEVRTMRPVPDLIAEIAPSCDVTVRDWFASEIEEFRRGDN